MRADRLQRMRALGHHSSCYSLGPQRRAGGLKAAGIDRQTRGGQPGPPERKNGSPAHVEDYLRDGTEGFTQLENRRKGQGSRWVTALAWAWPPRWRASSPHYLHNCAELFNLFLYILTGSDFFKKKSFSSFVWRASNPLPPLHSPTGALPSDFRKKEKYLKHLTGEASSQSSVEESSENHKTVNYSQLARRQPDDDVRGAHGFFFSFFEEMLCSLSGPLYFGRKCRKHVYKVYHHNRDCTIPACKPHVRFLFVASASRNRHSFKPVVVFLPDFKRCARLLTRLAVSPQCTEG